MSAGACCLSLIGVWNWRGRNNEGGKTALADWEDIALNDRTVWLAFDSDAMEKKQVHAALERLSAFLKRRRARVKIVYIEDNHSNVAFMEDLIGELDSVELVTASNAELGLELVRAHRPAVVILDINLPGMSGFDAMQRLRAWPETAAIPVIGLSAAAMAKDLQRARSAGFYRYLTKPVKVSELTSLIEELLARS